MVDAEGIKLIWPPPLADEHEFYVTSPHTGLLFPMRYEDRTEDNGEKVMCFGWGKNVQAAAEMTRQAAMRGFDDSDKDPA